VPVLRPDGFFGLTVIFDLRLLGWTMRKVPVLEFVRRLLPWTIAGFVVVAISGALLFYALPVRSYQNIFFRFKVILMLLAGLNVWIFHSRVYPKVADWDADPVPPKAARVAGALSLALWVGVVVSGRMIVYNWFDCDRQPQATPVEGMAWRLRTPQGKQLYALRKQTPEPVFDIIKSVMGFRQFLLHGLDCVSGGWSLVTVAWNIKRMHALSRG
jgi:hypothetical protein